MKSKIVLFFYRQEVEPTQTFVAESDEEDEDDRKVNQ